jgi:hypothetical protein
MCCGWPIEWADGLDQTGRLNSVHPCVVEVKSCSHVRGRLSDWSNLSEISGNPGLSPTNKEQVIRELQLVMKATWLQLSCSQRSVTKFASEIVCTSKDTCTPNTATSNISSVKYRGIFCTRVTWRLYWSLNSVLWMAKSQRMRADDMFREKECLHFSRYVNRHKTVRWEQDNALIAASARHHTNSRITVWCAIQWNTRGKRSERRTVSPAVKWSWNLTWMKSHT